MSIDHGKLLAMADAPPIPAWLIDADQSRVWAAAWETLYRAITRAQLAEAPHCKGHAYFDDGCIDCSDALERQRKGQPAEANKCEFCVDGWESFEGYGNVHHSKCDVCGGTGKKPAEAVEGLREFIAAQRPLPADMAAFVSENWHKYADFPNPPTDAAQGETLLAEIGERAYKAGAVAMADYITNRPALKEADADREDAVEYPDATGWAGPGHARVGDACPACPVYKSPRPKLVAEPVPGCNFARLNCEECGAGSYGLHYPPTDISEAVMQPSGVCPTCYQTLHITQAAPSPEVEKRCSYPNCNCPFDAPSDPNWCARGLKRHEVKDDAWAMRLVNELRAAGYGVLVMPPDKD